MKAMMTPTPMHSTVSQMSPVPYRAAIPPKPTMAEVEMKVDPYDSARMTGFTFFPATM
jgi:hypothetical protein